MGTGHTQGQCAIPTVGSHWDSLSSASRPLVACPQRRGVSGPVPKIPDLDRAASLDPLLRTINAIAGGMRNTG